MNGSTPQESWEGGDADRSGMGQERDGSYGTGRELRLMNRFCSPRPVPVPFTILLKIEMGRDGRWDGTRTGTDERSAAHFPLFACIGTSTGITVCIRSRVSFPALTPKQPKMGK